MWGSYRFVVIADSLEPDGLKTIDLGAGHSSSSETLCGRVLTALRSQALLNESVAAGYIERNWPPALKNSGAWPLASLRQSFLNGSLTRLLDPDKVLRAKIVEFVSRGDFGLASGKKPDGEYERVFFNEVIDPDEVVFEPDVFLLLRDKAKALKATPETELIETVGPEPGFPPDHIPTHNSRHETRQEQHDSASQRTFHIAGIVPPEIWNRLGTRILPKLRNSSELKVAIKFIVTVDGRFAANFVNDIEQTLNDLGLSESIKITQ